MHKHNTTVDGCTFPVIYSDDAWNARENIRNLIAAARKGEGSEYLARLRLRSIQLLWNRRH